MELCSVRHAYHRSSGSGPLYGNQENKEGEIMIHTVRHNVKENRPLIHCITNPISIHQCANAILAVGARPMMAEHPKEVREITESADALLLNLGNITDVRMESMLISAKTAREKGIPLVLDAVGVACSTLRKEFAYELLKVVVPTIIKGNYSEIIALYQKAYYSVGVDTDTTLEVDYVSEIAGKLAETYRTVILASGKTDIITDGKRLIYGYNGTPQLATVTGTGCMLGALCAAYLSGSEALEAAMTACTVLGICGELAQTEEGSGSFMTNLMNMLSVVRDADINKYIVTEERKIEET